MTKGGFSRKTCPTSLISRAPTEWHWLELLSLELETELIVLDDGFQHRRLARRRSGVDRRPRPVRPRASFPARPAS